MRIYHQKATRGLDWPVPLWDTDRSFPMIASSDVILNRSLEISEENIIHVSCFFTFVHDTLKLFHQGKSPFGN